MNGQWLGHIAGTNSGFSSLNVDPDRPSEGLLLVNDPLLPFAARVKFTVVGASVDGTLDQFHVPPPFVPGSTVCLPTTGTLSGTTTSNEARGTWTTDVGTSGTFLLTRAELQPARAADHSFSWSDFRTWVHEHRASLDRWIYRGHQQNDWPLVTTFHRTGRRNLLRYDSEDVAMLQREIEAVISKRHILTDPYDYGTLLNLGQHHGYPTPLLDWTESPFVAAFFAFEGLRKDAVASAPPVRVFAFDRPAWPGNEVASITNVRPCITPLVLGARDNPRARPQQSVNIFSNIVDIEGFIGLRECADSRKYLTCIDIPASERSIAMSDLAAMGITAASLFPGLDGACRALRERYF